MDNQIVDVQFEDGTISICQIIQQTGDEYIVSELICKRDGMCTFSNNTCSVTKDAVCGFYDVTKLEDTKLFSAFLKMYMSRFMIPMKTMKCRAKMNQTPILILVWMKKKINFCVCNK